MFIVRLVIMSIFLSMPLSAMRIGVFGIEHFCYFFAIGHVNNVFYSILSDLYSEIYDTNADLGRTTEILRQNSEELGKHLRGLERLSKLTLKIQAIIRDADNNSDNEETWIEDIATNILRAINDADKVILYLNPMISFYEYVIFLLTNEQYSKNKGMSFLTLSVIAPIILECSNECAVPVSNLLLKMLARGSDNSTHVAFLAKRKKNSEESFLVLENLMQKLITKPKLIEEYKQALDEHMGHHSKCVFKKNCCDRWLMNSYKIRVSEERLARQIIAISLQQVNNNPDTKSFSPRKIFRLQSKKSQGEKVPLLGSQNNNK